MVILNDLKILAIKTAQKMIKLHSEMGWQKKAGAQKIIYPVELGEGDNDIIRVSGSEAKFLFSLNIERYKKRIFYSVDTPTRHKYHFGKKVDDLASVDKGQPVTSDLTIFSRMDDRFIRTLNIEFLSQNLREANIAKSIFKLFCENQSGMVFHVLEDITTSTLKTLFSKYTTAIDYSRECIKENDDGSEKYIFFAVVALNKKMLFMKSLTLDKLDDLESFFDISYTTTKKKVAITNLNGWEGVFLQRRR